jgi:hypothetical protein
MRIDIMTDIETLGTGSDSTIFQISAIAFDINNGKPIAEFNQIANIADNRRMKVDGSTLLWWLNTDKELLTDLLSKGTGSSEQLLQAFHAWMLDLRIKGELHLWGNGILFDNKMIQYQLESIGMKYPIHYKNDRDVRTIVDLTCAKLQLTERELKAKFNDDELTAHNAFDDVKFQIKVVTWCYQQLIK